MESPARPPEQRNRWILVVLALGTALYQAVTVWINLPEKDYLLAGMACGGLLISLGMTAWLVLGKALNLDFINRLVLGIVSVWMVVHLTQGFLGLATVDTSHYLTHLMLVTIGFAVLRLPVAVLMSVLNFMLLTILTLTRSPQNMELLNDVGFLTLIIGYLTTFGRQVLDQQTRTVQLEHLARRDSLTNLFNRRTGQERLETLMAQHPRPTNVAVVLLDLDDFKRLNDTYGHAAGDEALRRVSRVLESQCRLGDLVCRWGGEEFLLILEKVNAHDALNVAQRIRAEVRELIMPFPRHLTLSGGLTMLHEAYSLAELLALVDRRLYVAKNAGRNRVIAAGHLFPETNGDSSKSSTAEGEHSNTVFE